jgi:PKD repeat protein
MFSDGRVFIRYPTSGVLLGPYGMGPDSNSNRPPSASLLVSPLKAPVNTTFYFNGSGVDPEGKNLTYSWAFSDGYNVSGKKNIVRKFNTSGNYSVTLTVKDIWGLTGTASARFVVTGSNIPPKNNPPVIITNLKSKNYVKLNSSVYISALRSYDPDGDKLSFQWIITNSGYNYSTIRKVAAFNYTFTLSGNFTFKLTVSDGKASTVAIYKFQCNGSGIPPRNQKPVAKPSVTVRGMIAYLSGAGSYDPDGKVVMYSWKVGSSSYKGKYHNHTFNSYGYKTATLTVKDDGGLTDSKIIGFYIYNRTRPNGTQMEGLDYNLTNIGSHIELAGSTIEDAILSVVNSGFDFQITLIESRKNYLKFLVESDSEAGRLVIIDIENDLIDLSNLDLVKLKIDDSTIDLTDFENIIQVTGEMPYYNIISDEGKYQLLVYFPHFSEHTLEIKVQDPGQGEQDGHIDMSVVVWPVILIVLVILIIIILIVFQEIKKKKEKEFFYDFRVAEDRTGNGIHTKGEKAAEEDEDWDDFL